MPLTLYDIAAEEHTIWARRLPNRGIQVRIENENDEEVYNETGHAAAWDELVYFAKQILAENERLECQDVE